MKKIILFIVIFLTSCSQKIDTEVIDDISTDSVLINSQSNLIQSDSIQKKSDSTTKEQVVKVIRDFQILNNEITKYKTERLTLMNQIQFTTEKVIYRIDTVYIETKKNFWGKEKTQTSVKSDSTTMLNLDSSISNQVIIDSIL